MKKEQYEFCISFYEICNKYLKEDIIIVKKDEYETDQTKIRLFKNLKLELEELLAKGDLIKQKDVIILDDFYDAYDLALMLHTYLDCIPENKIYLLRELFTFLNKYKNKVEENDYLSIWDKKIAKENNLVKIRESKEYKKLKKRLIAILILSGAIGSSIIFYQSKVGEQIINNISEFFSEDESLVLERKK